MQYRVLSIGVQGMADTMSLMNIGFEDEKCSALNR